MEDKQHVPASGEAMTEAVLQVARWVRDHCQTVMDPCAAITAVIPIYENVEDRANPEVTPWGMIKIHGNRLGSLVFESPWMVARLDPSAIGENAPDRWWEELGLRDPS